MKYILTILLLNLMYITPTYAEVIQKLQQRASYAYEEMMQAKREANILAKVVADAKNHEQRIEQKLLKAQQETAKAQKKSTEANSTLEQATLKWNQASDALSKAW